MIQFLLFCDRNILSLTFEFQTADVNKATADAATFYTVIKISLFCKLHAYVIIIGFYLVITTKQSLHNVLVLVISKLGVTYYIYKILNAQIDVYFTIL